MIDELCRIGIISQIKHEKSTIIKHYRITNLAKFINKSVLTKSHARQKKDKAMGIDFMNKEKYEVGLNNRLENLIRDMKSGKYKPKEGRRVLIPKANGKFRPLGIICYEDKVVSYVISQILSQVYECRFHDNSYGFRPSRNCHKAIKKLIEYIQYRKTNYIFETDIRGCFDNINHDWLIKMLELDIADKKLIDVIKKFLKIGIWERQELTYSEKGTPQGNPMSPVLTNIYLHYVLDMWIEVKVKPILKGEMNFIRYADDFVCCFQHKEDAEKFSQIIVERFKKFWLELADEKTRLIEFGRFANENAKRKGKKKAETFNFLGFTFYCSMDSHKKFYRVKVKTESKKMTMKIHKIWEWLMRNLTTKVEIVLKKLRRIMLGHYNYFGVTDNSPNLYKYLWRIRGLLFRWFNRQSQKKSISYYSFCELFMRLLEHDLLPKPKVSVSLLTY